MERYSKTSNKASVKPLKTKVKPKCKESFIVSARTPKSTHLQIDFKKPIEKLQSIQSIPTISYREVQTTCFPSEIYEGFSCMAPGRDSELKLGNFLSERSHLKKSSVMKDSFSSKLKKGKRSKRRETQPSNGKKAASFSRSSLNLDNVLSRTKDIIDDFKRREQEWKREKKELTRELEKYRRKCNGKSTATTCSSHNSHQSQKHLF